MLKIGEKIRTLRIKNDLTLQELASRCELTSGFLSQLENDATSPSIETLSDILQVLGTSIGEFFQKDEVTQVVFTEDDYSVDEQEEYLIKWIVPSSLNHKLEPIIVEIKPHGKSQKIRPHNGEEVGYVLEGKVKLVVGKKEYEIVKGGTFYLEGNQSHYLKNDESEVTKVLWISSPPSF